MKNSEFKIYGLSVFATIGVILLGFAVLRKTPEPKWKKNTVYTAEGELKPELRANHSMNEAPPGKKAITAAVAKSGTAVRITNLDTFNWPDTTIYLNGIAFGYRITIDGPKAGQSVTIPLNEFTTRDGLRFQPHERVPKEIVVSAGGFDGRQFNF